MYIICINGMQLNNIFVDVTHKNKDGNIFLQAGTPGFLELLLPVNVCMCVCVCVCLHVCVCVCLRVCVSTPEAMNN